MRGRAKGKRETEGRRKLYFSTVMILAQRPRVEREG